MIAVTVNDKQFNAELDAWFKAEKVRVNNVYQELATVAFVRIVTNTPQWSGTAVANWNVSVGHADMSYDTSLGTGARGLYSVVGDALQDVGISDVYQRGSDPGVAEALSRGIPVIKDSTYADNIFISNNIHGDSVIWGDKSTYDNVNYSFPYLAAEYQIGSKWYNALRSENLPIETLEMTAGAVNSNFSNIASRF